MSEEFPARHTQLKAKCLECGLHFIVCTEYPEKHTPATLHCPECGQHDAQYLTWSKVIPQPIYKVVPGDARPTDDIDSVVTNLKAKKIVPTQ